MRGAVKQLFVTGKRLFPNKERSNLAKIASPARGKPSLVNGCDQLLGCYQRVRERDHYPFPFIVHSLGQVAANYMYTFYGSPSAHLVGLVWDGNGVNLPALPVPFPLEG